MSAAAHRGHLCVVLLFASACTADFLIGDGTSEGGSSGNAEGSPTSTLEGGPTSASGAEEATTNEPTTTGAMTGDPTTGEPTGDPSGDPSGDPTTTTEPTGDPTLETGVEATLEGGVETTTTGGDTGGGVLDCAETSLGDCEDLAACDLYGEGEMQVCWADPCHPDAYTTCDGLGMDGCELAPLCHWEGDIETGSCAAATCGELEMAACLDEPACTWLEAMCFEIECPPCGEYGMEMCAATDGCTWHDVGEICVTD